MTQEQDYTPVIDDDGELAWQGDEDGEIYEMEESDQQQIYAAFEAEQQESQQQPEQEQWTQEEWDGAIADALEAEDRRLGRRLTTPEVRRFVNHVEETGEYPGESDWEPHSLDSTDSRGAYMAERMAEGAQEPYSSKTEEAQQQSEGSE
jgi:hypothetical protein